MQDYHIPVLLKESIDALQIKDGGIYIDATLGGGGHCEEILKRRKNIRLFAFDRDDDSLKHTSELKKKYPVLTIIKDNFENIRTRLALERIKKVDGILFDLGVSSHQFNKASRGFSFSLESKLDMRMDQSSELTAYEIINNFPYEELKYIFREYGEEKEAGKIAKAIVQKRVAKKIETTLELAEIIEESIFSRQIIKTKARVFQALRIFLNGEIDALKTALSDAVKILNPSGRIAVISYHSLEDRLVKKFFIYEEKSCICPPNFPKCICNKKSTLKIITKRPIVPTKTEIQNNSRARSAKLRIAEKKENS